MLRSDTVLFWLYMLYTRIIKKHITKYYYSLLTFISRGEFTSDPGTVQYSTVIGNFDHQEWKLWLLFFHADGV